MLCANETVAALSNMALAIKSVFIGVPLDLISRRTHLHALWFSKAKSPLSQWSEFDCGTTLRFVPFNVPVALRRRSVANLPFGCPSTLRRPTQPPKIQKPKKPTRFAVFDNLPRETPLRFPRSRGGVVTGGNLSRPLTVRRSLPAHYQKIHSRRNKRPSARLTNCRTTQSAPRS